MKRIVHGHSLVEVLIAVLVLALGGICYLALGTGEVQRAGAVRDRACAEDICWNLISVVEPMGGAFLARTAPDGEGRIVLDDLSSLAWFPSIHMGSPLEKWARDKGAAVGLTWHPSPTVAPRGKPINGGTSPPYSFLGEVRSPPERSPSRAAVVSSSYEYLRRIKEVDRLRRKIGSSWRKI